MLLKNLAKSHPAAFFQKPCYTTESSCLKMTNFQIFVILEKLALGNLRGTNLFTASVTS